MRDAQVCRLSGPGSNVGRELLVSKCILALKKKNKKLKKHVLEIMKLHSYVSALRLSFP